MYVMVSTRPDLIHVVSQVCKFMSKPNSNYVGDLDYRRSTIGSEVGDMKGVGRDEVEKGEVRPGGRVKRKDVNKLIKGGNLM
ncbi:hypothetical protein CR513_46820, partial [Mucuna pruriens]